MMIKVIYIPGEESEYKLGRDEWRGFTVEFISRRTCEWWAIRPMKGHWTEAAKSFEDYCELVLIHRNWPHRKRRRRERERGQKFILIKIDNPGRMDITVLDGNQISSPSKVHLGLRVTSSSVGIASSNGNVMRSSHKHTHLRKLHNVLYNTTLFILLSCITSGWATAINNRGYIRTLCTRYSSCKLCSHIFLKDKSWTISVL